MTRVNLRRFGDGASESAWNPLSVTAYRGYLHRFDPTLLRRTTHSSLLAAVQDILLLLIRRVLGTVQWSRRGWFSSIKHERVVYKIRVEILGTFSHDANTAFTQRRKCRATCLSPVDDVSHHRVSQTLLLSAVILQKFSNLDFFLVWNTDD